jgi:nicotinamide-nucleotide amidase
MNKFGSAPGMWIEKENKVFISLPGVPFEMKALIHNEVLPKLRARYKLPYIVHKTIITYGLGESMIAGRIEDWENQLPSFIKLAYLPNLGRVRLRLSAKGTDRLLIENEVNRQIKLLKPLIDDIFVGFEDEASIEVLIGMLLKERQQTLATAESCTGGQLANAITQVPGASAYFKGSVVCYATQSKIDVLNVDKALIQKYSVVSEEVAQAMALNAKKIFHSDYAISTTGNAGPTKGDSEAEVGTVCIAIATPTKVLSWKFLFGQHRTRVINKAVNKSFELLLKEISKN